MIAGRERHSQEGKRSRRQTGAVGAEVESFGMFEVGISDVGRDVDGFDVGFGVGWDVVGFDVTTLQARAGVFSAAYS